MKRTTLKLIGAMVAPLIISFVGCSSTKSATTSIPGLQDMSMSALKSAGGLYQSLGGAQGVNALAQSFGSKLALNPNVTKFLDAASIDAVKGGLSNTLAALAGQPLPAGGTDLYSALAGKKLDKPAIDGVATALNDAGKEMNLKPEQMNALNGVLGAVTHSLM